MDNLICSEFKNTELWKYKDKVLEGDLQNYLIKWNQRPQGVFDFIIQPKCGEAGKFLDSLITCREFRGEKTTEISTSSVPCDCISDEILKTKNFTCPECGGSGEVCSDYDGEYVQGEEICSDCPLCDGYEHISLDEIIEHNIPWEAIEEMHSFIGMKNCPECGGTGIKEILFYNYIALVDGSYITRPIRKEIIDKIESFSSITEISFLAKMKNYGEGKEFADWSNTLFKIKTSHNDTIWVMEKPNVRDKHL